MLYSENNCNFNGWQIVWWKITVVKYVAMKYIVYTVLFVLVSCLNLTAQTFYKSQLEGAWCVVDKTYNEGFSLIRTFNDKYLINRFILGKGIEDVIDTNFYYLSDKKPETFDYSKANEETSGHFLISIEKGNPNARMLCGEIIKVTDIQMVIRCSKTTYVFYKISK